MGKIFLWLIKKNNIFVTVIFKNKNMTKDFKEVYEKVLQQLNETFNPENFDEDLTLNTEFEKKGSLENPEFTFKRYNYQGNRMYIKLPLLRDEEGNISVGSEVLGWGYSLTTLIKKNQRYDGNEALDNWKVDMRNKGVDINSYVQERADFGTTMHYLFTKFLQGVTFKNEGFEAQIFKMIVKDKVLRKRRALEIVEKYRVHLYNSLVGFGNFCNDYKVEPIASELVVYDPNYGAATPLDLLCFIEQPEKIKVEVPTGEKYLRGEKKGEDKMKLRTFEVPVRKKAIIDFKSGNNFYDTYYFQLHWGHDMYEYTYGDRVDVLLNYRPKSDMSMDYVVKQQDKHPKNHRYYKPLRENAVHYLTNKFSEGIKIITNESVPKEVSFNDKKSTTNEVDYKIVGDEVILTDIEFKFNFKTILENEK